MHRIIGWWLGISLLFVAMGPGAFGQGTAQADGLSPETSVKLVLLDRLRSGDCRKNDRVNFKIDEDVVDGAGTVLIRKGTPAFGTVLNSRRAGAWGRRGALDVSVDYTTAVDGQKVPLRANKSQRGGGSKGLMTAGALLVAWPLAFCKGSNVTIDAGTTFVAYVDANLRIGAANGPQTTQAAPGNPGPSTAIAAGTVPAGMKAITLRNGDRLTGKVLGLRLGVYEIETPMGVLKIKEKEVASIVAGPDGTSPSPATPANGKASDARTELQKRVEELRQNRTGK
ncbi:MAG: hypothetical protein GX442_22730 [Candidatus Riflebacteria bacterium]|nr:hypothetical protein [Candidatus Riflebacteria bacterium]